MAKAQGGAVDPESGRVGEPKDAIPPSAFHSVPTPVVLDGNRRTHNDCQPYIDHHIQTEDLLHTQYPAAVGRL
ncbi:hypothetical protein C5613_43920 [Rhodococcus opacus]|uniref:Uncharacterized protein n=1 Tax=Rhodococcus opacus TaxID=37919 RepID=A0A2S8I7Y8_RHOOP|nr:hypothetical protein C5613_43920 [Rhodococcus opacus]